MNLGRESAVVHRGTVGAGESNEKTEHPKCQQEFMALSLGAREEIRLADWPLAGCHVLPFKTGGSQLLFRGEGAEGHVCLTAHSAAVPVLPRS